MAATTAGAGVRLLLAARAAEGALLPPAALILGGTAAGAMGLAFAPFALAGALPTVAALTTLALAATVLAGTLAAWALLRRAA